VVDSVRDVTSPGWTWLRSALPCDVSHVFPVAQGGELVVGPGPVPCRVGLGRVRDASEGIDNDDEGPEASTWIEACVELIDSAGRVFRCIRLVRTYTFVLAGTMADSDLKSPAFTGDVPLFKDVRSGFEEQITTVFTLREIETYRAVGFYCRHGAGFDLWIERRAEAATDRLVIEIHDDVVGGLRDGPRPALTFASELAAVIILWPLLVHPGPWRNPLPQVFEQTDGFSEPQHFVEWVR
jgi:hypothetical protein